MFEFLSLHLWTLVFGLLTLLTLGLIAVIISAAVKTNDKPSTQQKDVDQGRTIRLRFMKRTFRLAVNFIESKLASQSQKYDFHWSIVFDEGASDHTLPFAQAGIQQSFGFDFEGSKSDKGVHWDVFDKGLTVQFKSAFLGKHSETDIVDNKTWGEFLTLCEHYRSQRPFDSVVIAIPFAELLSSGLSSDALLAQRARALQRRIWEVQSRFALTFPVYVLITECESIPGFGQFAAALSPSMHNSMLGWSNAQELSAPFHIDCVDVGLDEILVDLQEASVELAALESGSSSGSGYFMLPRHMEQARPGLRLFFKELFKPSSYHSAFPLRGFYFTGDTSPESQILSLKAAPFGGQDTTDKLLGEPGTSSASLSALDNVAFSAVNVERNAPAFLRDVMELKVFAETGLVRQASNQRLRRSRGSWLVKWGVIAFVALWAVGLAFTGVRLSIIKDEKIALDREYLSKFILGAKRDADDTLPKMINQLKGQISNDLAVTTNENSKLQRFRSPFLPGSWSMFSNIDERLSSHFASTFSKSLKEDLRRLTYARISELTGSRLDNISGKLTPEKTCMLPNGWVRSGPDNGVPTVDPEDQAAYFSLMRYLAVSKDLGQAISVINRFKSSDQAAPSSAELRFAFTILLGQAPATDTNAAHAYLSEFRDGRPLIDVDNVYEAFGCSLNLGIAELEKSQYEQNPLLRIQQKISTLLSTIGSSPIANGQLKHWTDLSAALKVEAQLISDGRGAWINLVNASDDPSIRLLLDTIKSNPMLGSAVSVRANNELQTAFQNFKTNWLQVVATGRGQSDLMWVEKTREWTASQDRQALAVATDKLLGGPWRSMDAVAVLPKPSIDEFINWEVQKLDQALAITDEMQKIKEGLIQSVPLRYRADFNLFFNQQIVSSTAQLISRAVVWTGVPMTNDAERASVNTKLAKLSMVLKRFDSGELYLQMQDLVSSEAISRLYLIDDAFNDAELLVPVDAALRTWKEKRSPMAAAYGVTNTALLQSYVEQQVMAITEFAKQAEVLLSQVSGLEQADPLVQRWKAIVQDVERYKLKNPRSSLYALESFILVSDDKFNLQTCARDGLASARSRDNSHFQLTLTALSTSLGARCQEIVMANQVTNWTAFADYFNTTLSNHFPFVDPQPPVKRARSATADEIRTGIELFDKAKSAIAPELSSAPALGAFIQNFEALKPLLTPLVATVGKKAIGYDVGFEFRVARAYEKQANAVIAWELQVGKNTLRSSEPSRKLFWELGNSVILKMRLAQDALIKPFPLSDNTAYSADGQTVTFSFDGPWSLLQMVSAFEDTVAQNDVKAGVNVLSVSFPWRSTVLSAQALSLKGDAKVLLGFELSPHKSSTLLMWPQNIPSQAPHISQ